VNKINSRKAKRPSRLLEAGAFVVGVWDFGGSAMKAGSGFLGQSLVTVTDETGSSFLQRE
jgi:hypothetical protein